MPRPSSRDKIREAALELFRTKGYQRTSIGSIETAAGVAPRAGTFYRHFESKEALLRDLSLGVLSETPAEFGLDELALMGDTRAELIAIAVKYEEYNRLQAPFLALFAEVRGTDFGGALEDGTNEEMTLGLIRWLKTKPASAGKSDKDLAELMVMIFGSWLFALRKFQEGVSVSLFDQDSFLESWADYWAAQLGRPLHK